MKVWLHVIICAAMLCGCSRDAPTTGESSAFARDSSLSAKPPLHLDPAIGHAHACFPQMSFKQQDAGEVGHIQYGSLMTNKINVVVNLYEPEKPGAALRALKLYLTNKGSAQSAQECVDELVKPFATGLFDNGTEIWEALHAVDPFVDGVRHLDFETHGVSLSIMTVSNDWQSISFDLISAAEQAAMQKRYFKE